jgi:hypothetical protein
MKIKLFIILIFVTPQLFAQVLAKFEVRVQQERLDATTSVCLDGLNYNTDSGSLVLYELTSKGEKEVPSQLETGHSARLWFILTGKSFAGSIKTFILKKEETIPPAESASTIALKHSSKDLRLIFNDKPILNYRFATTYPPEGVDPIFKRSGFIHPLWSPEGEVLTRIQPPDHYHHYGIWGPWTHTHIGNRAVDFWNLATGEGTVKFAGFLSEVEGAVYSGFKVLQQHIDFGAKGEDEIALNEILDVRAWNANKKDKVWIIEYTTSLNCPLDSGIMLDAYRYGGGIGFRATEKWTKDNCSVLTSVNKTRADADGSFARWCIVEGESGTQEGRSGILFMSHPSNRKHPEPMRVWPLDANGGRGDMYFEFVPIRYDDWKLEQRKEYTLKYRMIVFDGKMDAKTAELYWNSFAYDPEIKFIKQK